MKVSYTKFVDREEQMNWNVFVTRRIPQPGIDILSSHCAVVDINPHDRPLTHEELKKAVKGRDGILCLLTDAIDRDIIMAADQARIFANYAVGFNNIDVGEATKRGIMISNTPGVLTEATADLTWALILAIARRIVACDRFTRQGRFKGWDPMLLLGSEVAGRTLGIIGAGRIGTAVGLRSAGFHMRVLYTDTDKNDRLEKKVHAERVDMKGLLEQSDYVTLHVPLLPETTHLIGRKELTHMKKTAFLINTCRGPVIDERALVDALKSQSIGGAALDVYENEPVLADGLAACDNAILMPHIGSATYGARTKMATMAAENLVAGLKGNRPPNLVNPDVLK